MKALPVAAIALSILFAAHPAEAQNRWSLQFRSGAAVATEDLGDAEIGTGFGFEGTVSYRFLPHLATYAGWGWTMFSADQSFAGPDVGFEETGYTFGLEFIHPLGKSGIGYLLRVGGILNHIEVENDDGDIIGDSGHGLGWQFGTGLAIPLSDRWSMLPSVRYRSLSRSIEFAGVNTDVDLSYVSAGVGISWSF